MKNILLIYFVILCIGSGYKNAFAQATHYYGIANVIDTGTSLGGPSGCDCVEGHWNHTSFDSAEYIEYYTGSTLDSVNYSILVTISETGFPQRKKISYTTLPANLLYQKKDADSIVFQITSFIDTFWVGCNSFAKFCPTAIGSSGVFSGIIRIAAATAGLSHENVLQESNIFPNPASNFLTVNSSARRITIADDLGRIELVQSLDDGERVGIIDVSSLPAGCYSVIIENGKQFLIRKFIKY